VAHVKSGAQWAWAAVLVVFALVYALVIPQLPRLGPDTQRLTHDSTLYLSGSTVTFPAGWEVDVASVVDGAPVATDGTLTVRLVDGFWFGGSDLLVERVAQLVGADGDLPSAPPGPVSDERQVWRIDMPSAPGEPARRVDVVRWTQLVVVVITTAAEGAADDPAVDAIVDSVDFGQLPLDAGNPTGDRVDARLAAVFGTVRGSGDGAA